MHVLLVDDSPVSRLLLRALLEDEGFRVSEADCGEAALAQLSELQPDLISMDVHMPGLDGFETTRRIMAQQATPIAIVTAAVRLPGAQLAMRALEAGALAVVDKPVSPVDPDFDLRATLLVDTLRRLGRARVQPPGAREGNEGDVPLAQLGSWRHRLPRLLAIGASAGGPPALRQLFAGLDERFPLPVLLVQHITPGFVDSYIEWLSSLTDMHVRAARAGEVIRPGCVYVAPDHCHLTLDGELGIVLTPGWDNHAPCPGIDTLFDSLATSVRGELAAIVLSGMGADGARGLAQLKALGALTLVQQPASAVVDGMPQAAIASNAACFIQTPAAMGRTLRRLMAQ